MLAENCFAWMFILQKNKRTALLPVDIARRNAVSSAVNRAWERRRLGGFGSKGRWDADAPRDLPSFPTVQSVLRSK